MTSPDSAVTSAREHIDLFNACVDTGDWSPFVATYHPDAVLELGGSGVPPLRGREAIARFYTSRPPREHMIAHSVAAAGDGTVMVRFAWDSGGLAALTARWDGASVVHARLTPVS